MKFKVNKRVLTVVAVAAIVGVALLAGRSARQTESGDLDDAAKRACEVFADGRAQAKTKVERLALADKVTAYSGWSKNDLIAKRAAEMGRSAGGTDAAWKTGADALTSARRNPAA